MCIEEVTTLLQHLNVLIRKHDEDTLQELKLTRYYRVFSAETSDRHDTVRDAIYDIHNFVETETNKHDEMLKDSDAYTETEHLKKYVALREVAKLLFKERVPSAAAATCTVAEPRQDGDVMEPTEDDAVGGKRVRHEDATEPAKFESTIASTIAPTASSSESSPPVASTSDDLKSNTRLAQTGSVLSQNLPMENIPMFEIPPLDMDSYSAAASQRSDAESLRPSTSAQKGSTFC